MLMCCNSFNRFLVECISKAGFLKRCGLKKSTSDVGSSHRNQTINRKGTYMLADIHGMDHFRKLESCVSKINTPMVMVWFGNV
jgi:hypothetical protein